MKIDAKIRIKEIADNDMLKVGDMVTIPIDENYVNDFDDVIKQAESYLWTTYGMSLCCNENFVVVNETDICDDIFNKSDSD